MGNFCLSKWINSLLLLFAFRSLQKMIIVLWNECFSETSCIFTSLLEPDLFLFDVSTRLPGSAIGSAIVYNSSRLIGVSLIVLLFAQSCVVYCQSCCPCKWHSPMTKQLINQVPQSDNTQTNGCDQIVGYPWLLKTISLHKHLLFNIRSHPLQKSPYCLCTQYDFNILKHLQFFSSIYKI